MPAVSAFSSVKEVNQSLYWFHGKVAPEPSIFPTAFGSMVGAAPFATPLMPIASTRAAVMLTRMLFARFIVTPTCWRGAPGSP